VKKEKKKKVLTQIIAGKTSFLSRGVCSLVINGEVVELPIKSIGIAELQNELEQTMPRPPSRMEVIAPDSDIGKKMEIKEDTPMRVHDLTDEKYIKESAEYSRDFVWRMIIPALDLTFQDEAGNEITGYAEKKKALQDAGISGHHLDALMKAVQDLTKAREDKADFLSGKPSE